VAPAAELGESLRRENQGSAERASQSEPGPDDRLPTVRMSPAWDPASGAKGEQGGRAAGGTRARPDGPPPRAAVLLFCTSRCPGGPGRCRVSPLGGVVEGAKGDRRQGRGSSLPLGSVFPRRWHLSGDAAPLFYGRVVFQKREVIRRQEPKARQPTSRCDDNSCFSKFKNVRFIVICIRRTK